jgi:hypothetical protein
MVQFALLSRHLPGGTAKSQSLNGNSPCRARESKQLPLEHKSVASPLEQQAHLVSLSVDLAGDE